MEKLTDLEKKDLKQKLEEKSALPEPVSEPKEPISEPKEPISAHGEPISAHGEPISVVGGGESALAQTNQKTRLVLMKGNTIIKEYERTDFPTIGPGSADATQLKSLVDDLVTYLEFKQLQGKKPAEKEFFNKFLLGELEAQPMSLFICKWHSWRKNKPEIWQSVKEKANWPSEKKPTKRRA